MDAEKKERLKKAGFRVGSVAEFLDLSPEEQEKYEKLKKGIEVKLSKISKLKKDKRSSSDDFKVLKQLINRDDVKKLFKSQGVSLKDLVSDIIK